jgi:hypothetical protein
VIVTGRTGAPLIDGHCGYIAGRYRDGALSDTWTDVTRCAHGTFTGYAPACTCGWSGAIRPSTPSGLQACQQDLITEHLNNLVPARRPVLATVSSLRARSITNRECLAYQPGSNPRAPDRIRSAEGGVETSQNLARDLHSPLSGAGSGPEHASITSATGRRDAAKSRPRGRLRVRAHTSKPAPMGSSALR